MMEHFFIQISTGQYSFNRKDHWGKEILGRETGHCIYGLDDKGQMWKWAIREGKGQWVEFEKCLPDYDG
jgi:hypothetical protein